MNATQQTKVLVIGGGYSGIGTAIRLNQAGIDDYILIEKAAKLGGTWRENTYPMAGADTPSIIYSFSYARNPDWDYTFALQPQIEKYLDDVADRFDVPEHVQFNTAGEMAEWDEAAHHWVVQTNNGTIIAKYVITCAGPMHEAALPNLPGVDTFTGDAFHTARWDHDVDLKGKRVAVIGTGASAIQYVPIIQKRGRQADPLPAHRPLGDAALQPQGDQAEEGDVPPLPGDQPCRRARDLRRQRGPAAARAPPERMRLLREDRPAATSRSRCPTRRCARSSPRTSRWAASASSSATPGTRRSRRTTRRSSRTASARSRPPAWSTAPACTTKPT